MKTLQIVRTLAATAAFSLVPSLLSAQVPAAVQVPFGQAFAGELAGSTPPACKGPVYPQANATSTNATWYDNCPATAATLNAPYAATVDSLGNVYIGDYNDYSVRVIYQGGTALAAALAGANPQITNFVATPGNIYTLAGSRQAAIPTTYAAGTSSGTKSYYCDAAGGHGIGLASNGDGCPAGYGYMKPRTITLDKDGNVFFTSASGASPVRVVYVAGTAAAALIKVLNQGAIAQPGYIYSIIKVSSVNGYNGDGGLATLTTVQTYTPRDVAVDSNENVYMSDGTNVFTAPAYASNNNIRMVTGLTNGAVTANTGIISTFAGANPTNTTAACAEPSTTGCPGAFAGDGGLATNATFNAPYVIFLDSHNNLYIDDYNEGRLRVVYNSGTVPGLTGLVAGHVYTVVGGGTSTVSGTPANQIALNLMYSSGIDAAGNLWALDGTSKVLWRIDAVTGIATITGGLPQTSGVTPTALTPGAYCNGGTSGPQITDKIGDGCPATQSYLAGSGRFTFDLNGNFYMGESSNNIIRRFSFNNQFPATAAGATASQYIAYSLLSPVTFTSETFSLEGSATTEFSDGGGDTCALNASLNIGTTCAYKINFTPARAGVRSGSVALNSATTTLSRLIGGDGLAGNASVDPASALTLGTGLTPGGTAADLNGNVYIADSKSGKLYSSPATASSLTTVMSGLSKPAQVAIDGRGGVYVADAGNNRIAYAPAAGGTVTSLGTGLSNPSGIAVDGLGNVFIADTGNNRIVEIPLYGQQTVLNVNGLTSPAGLALDALGDLFIADTGNSRIVELPANGTQITLNLTAVATSGGNPVFTPAGVAVDTAGDLFVLDLASLSVLQYSTGSTLANALVTGLTTPAGLAADAAGSLYVADAGAAGLLAYNRSVPTITFNRTNLNSSNSAALNVTSSGNAPLSFNGAQLASTSGSGAPAYSVTSAATNGCTTSTTLAPGASCALTATFTPTVTGTATATASLLTNGAGAAGALFVGPGVLLIATKSALAVTTPATTPIFYGQTIVVTETLTQASNGASPASGTIAFTVDGKAQPIQTLTGTSATVTLKLGVGNHSVGVAYGGDLLYASSSSTLSFAVAPAATTTTLGITSAVATGAATLTFTANVASVYATGETGTVTFYAGTTQLGTPQTISTSGVAVYTTKVTNFATNQFTAVYSGDANFAGSTSVVNQPAGDFAVAPTGLSFSTAQGGVATELFNLIPLYGYTGTIKATCSGLPANAVCDFSPTSVALGSGTQQTVQMLVYTNIQPLPTARLEGKPMRFSSGRTIAFTMMLPLGIFGVFATGRRMKLGRALLIAIVSCAGLLAGCQTVGNTTPSITPAGTSSVKVTFTDSAAVNHAQTVTFTVYTP